MKKHLFIIVVTVTMLVCLCACGKEPAAETQPPATETPVVVAPVQESPTAPEPDASPEPDTEPTAEPAASAKPGEEVVPPATQPPIETAPPAATATPKPSTQILYYQVRFGSFSSMPDAEKIRDEIHILKDEIRANYADAYIARYDGTFTIICGTFTNADSAKVVVEDLKAKGYDAEYRVLDADGKYVTELPATPEPTALATYYQVRVQGFTTQEDAVKMRDEIRQLDDPVKAGYAGAYVDGKSGSYFVACGTFSVEENAKTVQDDLIAKGYKAVIANVNV